MSDRGGVRVRGVAVPNGVGCDIGWGVSENRVEDVLPSSSLCEFLVAHEAPRFSRIPSGPGVYLFRDCHGSVLYVGKSKNLRARLRAHFRARGGEMRKKSALRNFAHTVAVRETNSHFAALLDEIELIHALRPRLNRQYARPERSAYLVVDFREPYPRLDLRHQVEPGPRYFGPVLLPRRLRVALDEVADAFRLRTCADPLPSAAEAQGCWRFQVKTCLAPCQGNVSPGDYGRHLLRALRLLTGSNDILRDWRSSLLSTHTSKNPQSWQRRLRRAAAVDRARRMLLLSRYSGDDAIIVQPGVDNSQVEVWAICRGDVARHMTLRPLSSPDRWFRQLWAVYSNPEEPAGFVGKQELDRRWGIYRWLRSREGRSSAVFVRDRDKADVRRDLTRLVRVVLASVQPRAL